MVREEGFNQILSVVRKILDSPNIIGQPITHELVTEVRIEAVKETASLFRVTTGTVHDKLARNGIGYHSRNEFDRKMLQSIQNSQPSGLWADLLVKFDSNEQMKETSALFGTHHYVSEIDSDLLRETSREHELDIDALEMMEAIYSEYRRKERRGQERFKRDLIKEYTAKCMVTGTKCKAVIDAAHIYEAKGEESMKVSNGLLLRADIHRLWDSKGETLIRIHPDTLQVEVVDFSLPEEYLNLNEQELIIDGNIRPDREALKRKYETQGGIL